MKQQIKRYISLLLALLLCVGLLALPASAEETATSGTCGENLTWKLETGILTISGNGAMTDYTEDMPAPWQAHAQNIQRVVVSDGVSTIGNMSFYHCQNLTSVKLPASVTTLGDLSFAGCTALAQISLSYITRIGWGSFYDCKQLCNIALSDKLQSIGDQAFYNCDSLSGITIPESLTEIGTSVFSYCENLVYVKILANIQILPYWTFYGCDRLIELHLPSSIEEIQHSALGECCSLNYVFYSGSEAVEKEIDKQLAEETIKSSVSVDGTKVEYTESEGARVTTTQEQSEVTVDATVTSPDGWETVTESVLNAARKDEDPVVNIEIQGENVIDQKFLEALNDRNLTVNIHTSENVDWKVVLKDQTGETLSGGQNLSIGISPNSSDKYADTIGDAKSYIVQMGNTSLNSTVLLPLGRDAARQNATLYVIDGGKLRKLASVIVDDDGKAAFALAGTVDCKYLVALNVQNISQDEVIIPEKLAPEYGIDYTYGATLTDSQGNQYVLTGRVNKLGFGIGTLTLIVVGILVGSMILVGIVMMLWNKQQKQKYAQYRRRK